MVLERRFERLRPRSTTGTWAVEMYIALKAGYAPSAEVEDRIRGAIEAIIRKIARPKNVWNRVRHAEDTVSCTASALRAVR